MKTFLLLLVLLSPGFSGVLSAQNLKLESGEQRVHLLELYTSEGCSSCPSADRWLSSLKTDERLWRELVPVAFHVDYWNYLGWSDRFSSKENSIRQAELAAAGRFTVYTPGFVLDGDEWRSGIFGRSLRLPENLRVGNLALEWVEPVARIRFEGLHQEPDKLLEAHIVQLGLNQKTSIRSGENHGKTLTHDFVVLTHNVVMLSPDKGGLVGEITLPANESSAIAAWVSPLGNPRPLQAIGGWLK